MSRSWRINRHGDPAKQVDALYPPMTIRCAVREGAARLRHPEQTHHSGRLPPSEATSSFEAVNAHDGRLPDADEETLDADSYSLAADGIGAISTTPALDSELLMAHTLHCTRGEVIAHGTDEADDEEVKTFFHCIERRQRGTPIAYITGHKEFYGLDFIVSPDVLIPKSDTETLVERAIQYITQRKSQSNKTLRLADICCGSGCVGISIAHECALCDVVFTDISQKALDTARLNAKRLLQGEGHSPRVEFLCGGLLDVFATGRQFDIIASNPPYVTRDETDVLLSHGRGEPHLALDGDDEDSTDGLAITRRLVVQAAEHLASGGALAVESSEEGVHKTALMMREAGLEEVEEIEDLSHLPRVAFGIKR